MSGLCASDRFRAVLPAVVIRAASYKRLAKAALVPTSMQLSYVSRSNPTLSNAKTKLQSVVVVYLILCVLSLLRGAFPSSSNPASQQLVASEATSVVGKGDIELDLVRLELLQPANAIDREQLAAKDSKVVLDGCVVPVTNVGRIAGAPVVALIGAAVTAQNPADFLRACHCHVDTSVVVYKA